MFLNCLGIWAASWQHQQNEFVHPVQTQISLGTRPVWSESPLCAEWVAKDPSFLHADSEDSDHLFLIFWFEKAIDFVGIFVVFSPDFGF